MKKLLSIILAFVLTLGLSNIFASASVYDYAFNQEELEELVEYGATEEQAKDIIRSGIIAKKMYEYGQDFVIVNNQVRISSPSISEKRISATEEEYMLKLHKENLNSKAYIATISPEKAKEEKALIEKMMKENPGRRKYKVTYDDGSWVQYTFEAKRMSQILDESAKPYASYHEMETAEYYFPWDGDGNYNYSCTVSHGDSNYFYNVNVREYITVSENGERIVVYAASGGASSGGFIGEVSSDRTETLVDSTDIDENPTVWCWVQEKAIMKAYVSFTLGWGGISFSQSAGCSFTAYAIIKTSLAAVHNYDAIFV